MTSGAYGIFGTEPHLGDGTAPVMVTAHLHMHGSGTDGGWVQGDRQPEAYIYSAGTPGYYGAYCCWDDTDIYMVGTWRYNQSRQKEIDSQFVMAESKWQWVVQCWW